MSNHETTSLDTVSEEKPALPSPSVRAFLAKSTEGVAILDLPRGGQIVEVNAAFERLTHCLHEEALGSQLHQALPGDQWGAFEGSLQRSQLYRDTLEVRRRDGVSLHVDVSTFPLCGFGPQITHWAVVLKDATARVAHEHAVHRSEEQHRLLAETIRDLVAVHRPGDGLCLYASPASRAILNYEPHEITALSLYDLIHPENVTHARKVFASHVDGRAESTFVHRIRKKDGTYLWVETTSKARFGEHGEAEIVSTIRDISRRKETEATLTAMHGLLSAVYEAVPLGLCLIDNRSYVQLCNRSFSSLFTAEPAELAGRPIAATLPLTEISLASGRAGAIHTFDAYRRNGSSFPAELTVTPVKFTEETWRLLTLTDLTERRRIEARLREARQLESLGTLAGGIAHDFNNLLTIILGYAGLLTDGAHDPDGLARATSAIIEASRRGADVVRQLQLFANQHEVEFVTTDLQALIEDTIERTCADWPGHVQVSCTYNIADATLSIDPAQVALGLRHLLQNACDAMPQGGMIHIRTAETLTAGSQAGEFASALLVTVEDNGRGMDASTRARIFEPFFAKDKGPAVRGLGLAVVYGIMRAHRGSIEVDSAPGQGTRVHLIFPRTQPTTPVGELSTAPSPSSPKIKQAKKRVLVVEDEADIGELWENVFAAEEIPMFWARDGEEALRLFAEHRDEIGLLFTDIGLPGIDGWQVAQRIREEIPTLPLLFVSGAFKPGDRAQSELAEPAICLPKPFPPSEVITRVRALLPTTD